LEYSTVNPVGRPQIKGCHEETKVSFYIPEKDKKDARQHDVCVCVCVYIYIIMYWLEDDPSPLEEEAVQYSR
jgi:hypothetical protein